MAATLPFHETESIMPQVNGQVRLELANGIKSRFEFEINDCFECACHLQLQRTDGQKHSISNWMRTLDDKTTAGNFRIPPDEINLFLLM